MFNYNFLLLTCSVWQWSAWTMWTSLLKWCCQCLVNIKQIKKNSACLCLQAQMTKIPTFQLLCITIDITSLVCCIDFPPTPAPAGGHFGSIFHQNYIYYSYGRSGSGLFVLGFHKTQIKMVLDHTIYSLHDRWKMNKEACIEKRKCSAYQKLSQCSDCWRGYTSPDAHFASGFTESTGKCHIFPQGDFLNYTWDASISHETLQIQ